MTPRTAGEFTVGPGDARIPALATVIESRNRLRLCRTPQFDTGDILKQRSKEGSMPRHYIRIPPFIEEWFPGGAPANWRRAAFDDATAQGTCLVVELLPANDKGTRAAVHVLPQE
jgi:hypothetical protein